MRKNLNRARLSRDPENKELRINFVVFCIVSVFLLALCAVMLWAAFLLVRPAQTFTVDLSEPSETTYQIAARITGCPVEILYGIAFAESTGDQWARGDDGVSLGRFQINEKYHAERAKKWGEYNPLDPLDTAILTGFLYMENLALLGSSDMAIAAHRQGPTGVRKNGADTWYIERVRGYPRSFPESLI